LVNNKISTQTTLEDSNGFFMEPVAEVTSAIRFETIGLTETAIPLDNDGKDMKDFNS
jgi:hypothetical protein